MNVLSTWFSPVEARWLAWALLHFLWQGMALAALLAALMAIFRSAATRYVLAVSVLILMVAAPVATFFYLRQSANSLPATDASSVLTAGSKTAALPPARSTPLVSKNGISDDSYLWLLRIWTVGVLFFSLRTAGGMLIVERLQRRKASPVSARLLEICVDLQRKVGIRRAVRFCQCNGLDVPAVIGWFRPVVLLPMTVLTGLSQGQLEAVIVHELAHIKRWDYFVNLFQILAETLLFYHPAVWWVSRRIRLERESCCDDTAVWLCGNVVDYARALTYMEGGRTAPSLVLAANGSPLAHRVMRLLGRRNSGGRMLPAGLALGSLCLAGGLLLSQVFVKAARAAASQDSQLSAQPSATSKVPAETVVRSLPAPVVVRPVLPAPPVLATALPASPMAATAPEALPVPPTQATAEQPGSPSYIDSLKALGFTNLSVDDLVAMKIHGVTPDYVREIQALGLKPDADDLVAMRIHGVTPDYIRTMRAAGINADVDDLVGMKIQGVTPEYIRSVQELGLKPNADDLVAMRIHGVTPEFIRDIRALGLNPSADDLVAMQIHGVTPAYIKALSAAGISSKDVDDYVGAKIQGITPEFVEKARQHGFQKLDLDQLIALKHAGVL